MTKNMASSLPRQPVPGKLYDYYATCVGGLEGVVRQDLIERLPGVERVRLEQGRRHGRLFFHYERSPSRLLELRSVANVFVLLARVEQVSTGKPGLQRVAEALAAADLGSAVALHARLEKAAPGVAVRLVCTVSPNHRFSAAEAVRAIADRLPPEIQIATHPRPGIPVLHVTVEERRAVCGLQLGRRRLRNREYRHAAIGGGLDATVAYCMAKLAGLEASSVCLDPLCGGGTLLIEALQAVGARLAVGGDLAVEALAVARESGQEAGVRPRLVRWDAARLPVRSASVDAILCNLPFGKRLEYQGQGSPGEAMAEMLRVLRPGGSAVLLAGEAEPLPVDGPCAVRLEKRLRLRLRGVSPYLLVFRRLAPEH